jgi:hypothetical protein
METAINQDVELDLNEFDIEVTELNLTADDAQGSDTVFFRSTTTCTCTC